MLQVQDWSFAGGYRSSGSSWTDGGDAQLLADGVATTVAFHDSPNAMTVFRSGVRGPGQVSGLHS